MCVCVCVCVCVCARARARVHVSVGVNCVWIPSMGSTSHFMNHVCVSVCVSLSVGFRARAVAASWNVARHYRARRLLVCYVIFSFPLFSRYYLFSFSFQDIISFPSLFLSFQDIIERDGYLFVM